MIETCPTPAVSRPVTAEPTRALTAEPTRALGGTSASAASASAAVCVEPGENLDEKLRDWIAASQRLLDDEGDAA